ASADGKTDGDFLAPFRSAREEQVSQVHTGQEEDEETDRSENGRKREHTIPDIGNKQAGWNQLDPAPRIFLWKFLPQLDGQGAERSLRLGFGDSGFQTPDDKAVVVAATVDPV